MNCQLSAKKDKESKNNELHGLPLEKKCFCFLMGCGKQIELGLEFPGLHSLTQTKKNVNQLEG